MNYATTNDSDQYMQRERRDRSKKSPIPSTQATHLGRGHEINERLDHAGRLSLSDEGRGRGNDSLGTRNLHSSEEEPSELLDDPRHDWKGQRSKTSVSRRERQDLIRIQW